MKRDVRKNVKTAHFREKITMSSRHDFNQLFENFKQSARIIDGKTT
jgi:hypothetical protein